MATAPVDKINVGTVQLVVFENEIGTGKDAYKTASVSISKSYKDKNGRWQRTTSFKDTELMYIILACQERLKHKYLKDQVDEVEFAE